MKTACFDPNLAVRQASSHHIVGDVSCILPVVPDGRLGQLHRGSAVWIGDGAEGGIAYWRDIQLECRVFTQSASVSDSQTHYEIVWMLGVNNWLSVGSLAGLKEQRVTTVGDSGRFET